MDGGGRGAREARAARKDARVLLGSKFLQCVLQSPDILCGW